MIYKNYFLPFKINVDTVPFAAIVDLLCVLIKALAVEAFIAFRVDLVVADEFISFVVDGGVIIVVKVVVFDFAVTCLVIDGFCNFTVDVDFVMDNLVVDCDVASLVVAAFDVRDAVNLVVDGKVFFVMGLIVLVAFVGDVRLDNDGVDKDVVVCFVVVSLAESPTIK